jgi:hypothetical protein
MYLLLISRLNLRDKFPTVVVFVLCIQKLQTKTAYFWDCITTLFEGYLGTASASGAPTLKVCKSARRLLQLSSLYYYYYYYYYCCYWRGRLDIEKFVVATSSGVTSLNFRDSFSYLTQIRKKGQADSHIRQLIVHKRHFESKQCN